MPRNRQLDVNAAKAILDRIKGRNMQVFDVQTQAVHSEEEIRALKAALKHFIDYCDRDFKVAEVIEEGNMEIETGDSVETVLNWAGNIMDNHETSAILGSPILFKGTNGKWYTVVVESYVAPAEARLVREIIPKPASVGGYDWSEKELLAIRKDREDIPDAVAMCEYASKKFSVELTIKQAVKLMRAANTIL